MRFLPLSTAYCRLKIFSDNQEYGISADTLEEIAIQLGYGDTASFTRAFRRWLGQSPHEFRQAYKRQPI
jgi:AraC-like DNA-binding protein